MSRRDMLWFGSAGAAVWGATTLFYLAFAQRVIEQDFWIYTLNAALVAAALLLFFELTARFRHTPPSFKPRAALAFSAPGLAGAGIVALAFANLARHASLGRYIALLLVAYGILIALTFEKTRAAPARDSDRSGA